MKRKMMILCSLTLTLISVNAFAQNISSEVVELKLLKQPTELIDDASRTFNVTVTSPYNLTAEQVIAQSKFDHQQALANFDKTVANSVKEFDQKLKDYDSDVIKSKEKFALESAEFKKLSLLERLSMTDQGLNPKLVTPSKPVYVKPYPPVYQDPNLADYTIVDNNVLASQIAIDGFTRGKPYVDIIVDIESVTFQDNAGQTFAKQPTKLIVKVNGVEKVNQSFFTDFEYLSSSPSNNINQPREEKNRLTKTIAALNKFLNDRYGFQSVTKSVKISSVKNKGQYDDLARADIYVTTNLKKLQPTSPDANAMALANMQKGIDIWTSTLTKVDFKNSKSDFNSKIAEFIYFNLIRLNLAMNRKADAEKYLNELQENLIYIKLSYDEENELGRLEKEIYALSK